MYPEDVNDIRALAEQPQPNEPWVWTWGAEASLTKLYGSVDLTNQQLAEAAASEGVTVLSVGNLKDINFTLSGLYTTQFLRNGANGSNVYSREFSEDDLCGLDPSCLHSVVKNIRRFSTRSRRCSRVGSRQTMRRWTTAACVHRARGARDSALWE